MRSHWHKIIIWHIYCFSHMVCFFSNPTGPFCTHGRCSICPKARHKNKLEMLPVFRMGVQGPLYQDNSNKIWQLQGTITLETNFILMYVLNYIFLSSNILSISLYTTAWKIRTLNKSNILTSIEPINQILKKKSSENNFNNMGTQCTQFHKSRKFFCSTIQVSPSERTTLV